MLHRRNSTTAMLCAFTVALAAGLTAVAPARADDAVVDGGPLAAVVTGGVETPPSVGAGRGWVVWPHRDPDGRVALMGSRRGGPPQRLRAAPLDVVRSVDVGRGPLGSPAAIYRGCRAERCGLRRLDLATGRETRVELPVPRGCRLGPIAIDRDIFFSAYRGHGKRGCTGIYELVGRRAVLRQALDLVAYDLDVDTGDLAFEVLDARDVVQIWVRRRGAGRPRVIYEDNGIQFEAATSYRLTWDGRMLWMGGLTDSIDGPSGTVQRASLGPRLRCAYDKAWLELSNRPVPATWAFAGGHIYYAMREPDGSYTLRRRTNPRPLFASMACNRE